MEWFHFKRNFEFVGFRRGSFLFSGLLLLIAVASISVQGLRFGIDFTGGYLVEVGFEESTDLAPIRSALAEQGFEDAQVQHFGSPREVLIRIAPRDEETGADVSDRVLLTLDRALEQTPDMRRVEFVGPQVGEELREKGGLAMLYALGLILVYVAFRFEKRFAVGAVAALVHDVVIVVGVFSLTQIEFSLPVLAALLAVIGYSLNDTIVVFDRIRETFRTKRRGTPEEVTNEAINRTLPRTFMTSITTMLVLVSLLLFGGEAIFGFAFALAVGVIVGTYSSIFIAATLLLATGLSREDMMAVPKEGEAADERP